MTCVNLIKDTGGTEMERRITLPLKSSHKTIGSNEKPSIRFWTKNIVIKPKSLTSNSIITSRVSRLVDHILWSETSCYFSHLLALLLFF